MDSSLIIFLVAIIIVGILIVIAISMTSKHGHIFDKENYQVDFLRIEKMLEKDNPSSYGMVIIEGDKMLDRAMMEMGIQGRTMGDRLKRIGKTKFTQLNSVWHAHRLRNQIAHEHDFKPEYRQAQHALETYKQALKDLGAI